MTPYAQAALVSECDAVAAAPTGTRNCALNTSAFKIGGLVGAGQLAEDDATAQLIPAGLQAGLSLAEATASVRSGLRAGMRKPREVSNQTTRMVPAVERPRVQPAAPDVGQRDYGLLLREESKLDDHAVSNHPYPIAKGFKGAHGAGVIYGVRAWDGPLSWCVVVPIRAHGTGDVIAVQCINPVGDKRTYGSMTAPDGTPGYLLLGNELATDRPLMVAEGWADVVSLVMYSKFSGHCAGAVAFGMGRMDAVARQVELDTGRPVVVVEDDA